MSNVQILVIGRHPEIMKTITRLINNTPEWSCIGVLTNDEAITAFRKQIFDVILIGAGITTVETQHLYQLFNSEKPDIPVIQHYGGGSGLLFGEIYEALAKSHK
jgi:DNA-binding NarL/FixJ family response regulator